MVIHGMHFLSAYCQSHRLPLSFALYARTRRISGRPRFMRTGSANRPSNFEREQPADNIFCAPSPENASACMWIRFSKIQDASSLCRRPMKSNHRLSLSAHVTHMRWARYPGYHEHIHRMHGIDLARRRTFTRPRCSTSISIAHQHASIICIGSPYTEYTVRSTNSLTKQTLLFE